MVGLVLVPLVIAVVALANDHWHATGDMAQAELHVRGFFAHPPLVGLGGRIGTLTEQGSHPGPMSWFALLPAYRLLGQSSWALEAGTALVVAIGVVASLVVARRRGGWPLTLIVAGALLILLRSNGPEVFTEPWNVWMGVVPFFVFVLLVWSVVCDDERALVWAAVAGSYAVQSHVSYGVLVAGLGALAAVWAIRRRWWRTIAITAAVGLVLWAPPVIEQVTADDGWPGNLSILLDHFGSPDEDPVGPTAAVKAFAGELNVAGPWLAGGDRQPTDSPAWLGFVAMVALWGGAVAVAWRRRLDAHLRLHAVLGVACVLGLVSISRVFGDFFDYVIRWTWDLAALVGVAIVWTAWEASPLRWRRPLSIAGAAVLGVAFVAASVGAFDVESSGPRNSEIVAALTPELEEHLDRDDRYLMRWDDTVSLGATGVGVLLELEKRGYDVGAGPFQRAAVLPHRIIDDECDADAIVEIVVGPGVDAARARPGAEEVAVVDTRTAEERREFEEAAERLDDALREADAEDLTPAIEEQLIAIAVDPRLPDGADDDLLTLIELGLPAHAFVLPVQGCGP